MGKRQSKYIVFLEEIKRLHQEGLTNAEISRTINVDSRRISDMLKKNGIEKNIKELILKPNETQKQIILGTIIGDGCLFKDKHGKNYRMNLAHCLKQRDYFLMKYEIIKELILSDAKEKTEYDKRTCKNYYSIGFQSKSAPYYTNLYGIWYKNKKKIIPLKEIEKMESLGLAIKYFDDGNKIRKTGQIAMNDYDIESIENFRQVVYKKFNVATTLQSEKTVYIPVKEFITFKEIILPHATTDVLYKLGELLETPNV